MKAKFRLRTNAVVVAHLLVAANTQCRGVEAFSDATPESQGLSSQSLAKLLDVVRGSADRDEIVGGELLVIKNRRTVLDATVGLGDRPQSEQVEAGDPAWIRPVASSPFEELPERMAKSRLRNGWMFAIGDWRSEYQQARVLKRVDLDGKPALMVHAAPQAGHQRLIYFDPESGLTLGYDQEQDITGVGAVGSEVRFSDFHEVGGVQLPFKATTTFPTPVLGTVTYQVQKVETDVKLDEDPFRIK